MSSTDADTAGRVDDLLRGAWVLAALARAADTGDPLDPELGAALAAAGFAEQAEGAWRLLPEYRALSRGRGAGGAGLSGRIGRMLRWAADAAEGLPAPTGSHSDAELREEGDESGRRFAALLDALAGADSGLRELLASPGLRFLDIGTGTAAIAATVAVRVPGSSAVGLDRDPHVLGLAAERIASGGLGGRVRVQCADAAGIAGSAEYDLAWLPLAVLEPEAALEALPRLRAALRPGGTLIAATVLQDGTAAQRDPLGQALARWRMARAGITTWTPEEAAQRLRDAGFTGVRRPEAADQPVAAVLARAPEHTPP
ncbi:class I SAM-dependent methyltransferase [Streptomonospora sp. PA3]|uniref:SAM-dependent methyltransferase n=1 Tax=Streptomonospora sp. PA3 TaxID=2607326 RepID=UPI0012DE4BAA|nr:class I SAM-dependent methyltransferase [Streptomonospora sp. PA3]MUL42888.1 class I SAM-dependent methyltransferase [Streptomonospora sp. PA3]